MPLGEEIPLQTTEENGLSEALSRLSPLYRSVIYLYYYEGYQAEEIAKLLNRKADTVRTQLARARAQLANIMKENFDV
ncbi:MAG: sigma-70 family RNA polymerase sigma factor [Clostridia bacterium]